MVSTGNGLISIVPDSSSVIGVICDIPFIVSARVQFPSSRCARAPGRLIDFNIGVDEANSFYFL